MKSQQYVRKPQFTVYDNVTSLKSNSYLYLVKDLIFRERLNILNTYYVQTYLSNITIEKVIAIDESI